MEHNARQNGLEWKGDKRKFVFVVLFAVAAVAQVLIVGRFSLWASLFTVPATGGLMLWLWRATSGPSPHSQLNAGGACPSCASLQTDTVLGVAADGEELWVPECFACGHRWSTDGSHQRLAMSLEPDEARKKRRR
jgi:Zn ribbon nucleic-acid-binding protein